MNIIATLILGIFGLGIISQYQTNKNTNKTETPKFELLEDYGIVEIRKYPQMILATATMGTGKYSNKSNKGFRIIASYIFGGNDENKQISMTAPVIASMGDTMNMSFIMPSEYEMDELPQPNNEKVDLHVQPERILALISFGGFANDYDINFHTKLLKEELDQKNISYTDKVIFQGYNPPFQLFDRTNEVALELVNYE